MNVDKGWFKSKYHLMLPQGHRDIALCSPLAHNGLPAPPGVEQKEINCADNRRNLRLITKGTNKLPNYVQSRNVESKNI